VSDKDKIESVLKDHGFSDYKWIDPKDIIVSQWVRIKCTYGCGGYGYGTCPPNTPSVDECARLVVYN
jgi:predicted metal-binding protein